MWFDLLIIKGLSGGVIPETKKLILELVEKVHAEVR